MLEITDQTPPKITLCPPSRIEYVSATTETREITTVDPAAISATDNIGVVFPITVNPLKFTASATNLGKQVVTVTAYDDAGNSDTCKFEILVQGTFLIVDTCTMSSVILTFSL